MSESGHEILRLDTAAVRVRFEWLGSTKSLSAGQKSEAASPFGADGAAISASKKLVDTKHSAWKAVTTVKANIRSYWLGNTLPYPEDGVRLLKRSKLDEFNNDMAKFRDDLQTAVAELERHYSELRSHAESRLGTLFDPADYPTTLLGSFRVDWDFPSVEPPEYLRALNPEVFEQERQRATARYRAAIDLIERDILAEISGHVEAVATYTEESKPGTVENRTEKIDATGAGIDRMQHLLTAEAVSGLRTRLAEVRQACVQAHAKALAWSESQREAAGKPRGRRIAGVPAPAPAAEVVQPVASLFPVEVAQQQEVSANVA